MNIHLDDVNRLPLILQLNAAGDPIRWINYERSAYLHSRDRVLWSAGEHEVLLRGGINAATGARSTMTMKTIVAVKTGRATGATRRDSTPPLSNTYLFLRDRGICAYCANEFPKSKLTRDHVVPRSRGGDSSWTNLVTACKVCNNTKRDRTPDEAGMPLVYVPYVPNYNEHLILQNRNILADQMEYLLRGVSKTSRLLVG